MHFRKRRKNETTADLSMKANDRIYQTSKQDKAIAIAIYLNTTSCLLQAADVFTKDTYYFKYYL